MIPSGNGNTDGIEDVVTLTNDLVDPTVASDDGIREENDREPFRCVDDEDRRSLNGFFNDDDADDGRDRLLRVINEERRRPRAEVGRAADNGLDEDTVVGVINDDEVDGVKSSSTDRNNASRYDMGRIDKSCITLDHDTPNMALIMTYIIIYKPK
jgi:hypothetical protein